VLYCIVNTPITNNLPELLSLDGFQMGQIKLDQVVVLQQPLQAGDGVRVEAEKRRFWDAGIQRDRLPALPYSSAQVLAPHLAISFQKVDENDLVRTGVPIARTLIIEITAQPFEAGGGSSYPRGMTYPPMAGVFRSKGDKFTTTQGGSGSLFKMAPDGPFFYGASEVFAHQSGGCVYDSASGSGIPVIPFGTVGGSAKTGPMQTKEQIVFIRKDCQLEISGDGSATVTA